MESYIELFVRLSNIVVPIAVFLFTDLGWPYVLLGSFTAINTVFNKSETSTDVKLLLNILLRILFAWFLIKLAKSNNLIVNI